MENMSAAPNPGQSIIDPNSQLPQYHSIEFSISGLDFNYQFKLWNMDPDRMHIIIREDSNLLNRLKAGSRFNLKYYSNNLSSPSAERETEISYITKADGRFKGHYIVGLAFAKNQEEVIKH